MKWKPSAPVLLFLIATCVTAPSQTNQPDVIDLVEAQQRYKGDALTNHIKLDKPLYTNAPWAEIRLRAAALAGDGLAASLCASSNGLEQLFWVRLAATNGWLPSQIHLAKDYEYERSKELKEGEFSWEEVMSPELEEIMKQPKEVRLAATQMWRSKAKAWLPKLKDDAARNEARVYMRWDCCIVPVIWLRATLRWPMKCFTRLPNWV